MAAKSAKGAKAKKTSSITPKPRKKMVEGKMPTWMTPFSAQGHIRAVTVGAFGPNSGEVFFVLDRQQADDITFRVGMSNPPDAFLERLETALRAMWAVALVEVVYAIPANLPEAISIKVI